jgi:hypothetical protein
MFSAFLSATMSAQSWASFSESMVCGLARVAIETVPLNQFTDSLRD